MRVPPLHVLFGPREVSLRCTIISSFVVRTGSRVCTKMITTFSYRETDTVESLGRKREIITCSVNSNVLYESSSSRQKTRVGTCCCPLSHKRNESTICKRDRFMCFETRHGTLRGTVFVICNAIWCPFRRVNENVYIIFIRPCWTISFLEFVLRVQIVFYILIFSNVYDSSFQNLI